MGTNPHIERIYNLYWDAFERFRQVEPVDTMEKNVEFCKLIQSMLDKHLVAIPYLARGIADSSDYMTLEEADRFMNETLRSRIGRRVLAEHQIALTNTFLDGHSHTTKIGVVDTQCSAHKCIQKCAQVASEMFEKAYQRPAPLVVVDGYLAATFTYIPDHIEYLLFELIKNSMRYSIKFHGDDPLPPIRVTIGMDRSQVVIRVSDQAGGIEKGILDHIWSWTHAAKRNLDRLDKVTHLAGKMDEQASFTTPLGLGLPMSLVFTHYWGGSGSLGPDTNIHKFINDFLDQGGSHFRDLILESRRFNLYQNNIPMNHQH